MRERAVFPWMLTVCLFAGVCPAAGFESVPLPDGSMFETWEKPLVPTHTYYVDRKHPHASDKNPGTAERPWLTISHAADVLMPGERVVVHGGVYREWVKPQRGGTGPDAMIAYEAAPGEEVIIKGSDVWTPEWRTSSRQDRCWQADLSPTLFEGANVFCLQNFPVQTDTAGWQMFPGCELRRGQIFMDGLPLTQVGLFSDVPKGPNRFWVEENGMRIHVQFAEGDQPSGHAFEITTREQVFAPIIPYLNYIRVSGFRMLHAANGIPIPPPQRGLLSATRGHHWIIENCEIGYANTLGMDLGGQWWDYGKGEMQGYHIVRKNFLHHCGVSAISAWHNMPNTKMLVEDNLVTDCSELPVLNHYESAGIKIHRTEHSLVRRNVVLRTQNGPALWLDGEILNTRVTQNLLGQSPRAHWGAVFFEINKGPNLCDNNVIIDVGGSGVYEHDAERMVVLQNLIVRASEAAICFRYGDPNRVNPPFENHHRAFGNVLAAFGWAVQRPNPTTQSDCNLLSTQDWTSPFREQEASHDPAKMNIEAWRALGQDVHSLVGSVEVHFHPEDLSLGIVADKSLWTTSFDYPEILPEMAPARDLLTRDFFNRPRTSERLQLGPFNDIPLDGTLFSVDPRK